MSINPMHAAMALAALAVLGAIGAVMLWRRERTERLRLAERLRREPPAASVAALPAPVAGAAPPPDTAGLLDRRQLEAAIDRLRGEPAHPDPAVLPCLLWLSLDGTRRLQQGQLPALVDAALINLARRVRDTAPPGSRVARLGSTEYAVFLSASNAAQALSLAEALRTALAEPIDLAGNELRLGCSVGIASGRQEAKMLCARAAVAMRSVQHAGGDGVAVFDPHMALDEQERTALIDDLRLAVQRRQVEIYYQPCVDTRTMQVPAAEALLRWRHPQRGLVPPTEFIRLAEECGAIEAFGNWVVDSVLDQAAEWQKRRIALRVAVNLSGFQMRQDTLASRIEQGLRAHQLRPEGLCLEIDAARIAEDPPAAQRLCAQLAKTGVQVSIDSFGSAGSNLALLRRVPAEEVKLHRALVAELGEADGADARCKAIIDMAHSRGQRVVATGVETEEQRDRLVALGCDALQGHLFAKAMSPKELTQFASDSPQSRAESFRATILKDTEPFDGEVPYADTRPFEPTRPMEDREPPQTPQQRAA